MLDRGRPRCMSGVASLAKANWLHPRGLPAGPKDRLMKNAAGLATKLPVLWQWTGRYFEHWL